MLLIIIVKKALLSCFSGIHATAAGSGIMGVLVGLVGLQFLTRLTGIQGNKGGTAIRVAFTPLLDTRGDLNCTVFTFVNAHLAAFDEQYDRRNSDFQDLSNRLNFDSEMLDASDMAPLPINIYQSDVLFWMVRSLLALVFRSMTLLGLLFRAVCA